MRGRTRLVITVSIAVLALIVGVIVVLTWPSTPARSDVTHPNGDAAISGYVYYDRNDNGVRDPGEPGIAGIRVRDKKGDLSTVTATDGSYSFATLPSSGFLQVETGWFRSQCPPVDQPTAMFCPAGTGTSNEFAVNNQFIQYPLTAALPGRNIDVGLLPDWPGRSMTVPAPVDGVVPANPVDVAARLSWQSGDCAGGDYAICTIGNRFTMVAQVFNQGTSPLTGIHARLYVPPGDCVTGVSLLPYSVPAGLGGLTVAPPAFTCDTRYVELSLAGRLVPAGGVRLQVSGETESGPGTPGCLPKAIDKALCPIDEPQSRGWLFGVSRIDQTGDPDSTFCAAGDMTRCPIGLHDKRRAPDEIDPAGHTVNANLGGGTAYDLHAHVIPLDPAPTVKAGGDLTLRAWVSNQVAGGDTNASPEHFQVVVWLPAGVTVLGVPPPHKLITCDSGRKVGEATMIICILGGPVAPYLSSPAIDVTVGVPASWSPAVPLRTVVCILPPGGAVLTETVPAGFGCNLSTDADATPSDNDADYAWTVTR